MREPTNDNAAPSRKGQTMDATTGFTCSLPFCSRNGLKRDPEGRCALHADEAGELERARAWREQADAAGYQGVVDVVGGSPEGA